MLLRFGCLFVLVPLAELALLIWVGRAIGLWPTLLIVGGTGILGANLARREGIRALVGVQRELASGRLPARSLWSGAAVLVGGAFLLTPGLLTDIAGFLLLFPPTRAVVFRWFQRRMTAALRGGTLRMSVWHTGSSTGGPGPRSAARGQAAHGRVTDFPFQFGARSEATRDEKTDESPPARPGEIIQD